MPEVIAEKLAEFRKELSTLMPHASSLHDSLAKLESEIAEAAKAIHDRLTAIEAHLGL